MTATQTSHRRSRRGGFTLLELLLAIAVIAVLVSTMFTLTNGLRRRAESAACMANMKSLFTGLATYTAEYKHWPQPPKDSLGGEEDFWKFWLSILDEYDVPKKTWICPTHARLTPPDQEFEQASYLPAWFDASSPRQPYLDGTPWLMETGNNHGRGPLVLYPDASIRPFSVISMQNEPGR